MSAPGQDNPAPDSDGAPSGSRWKRRLLAGVAAVCAAPVVGAAALLLMMQAGPVDVTFALRPFLPLVIVGGEKGQPPRGRLDLSHVRLRWSGLRDGAGAPVLVEMDDLRILDNRGQVADRIASGAVALDGFPLLHGVVAVSDLQVRGARVVLRRTASGDVDLDLPGRPSRRGGGGFPADFSHLHRLILADTRMVMTDDALHTRWEAAPVAAALAPVAVRRRRGLAGRVEAAVTGTPLQGGQGTPFHVKFSGDGALAADNALVWHLTLDPVVPASLAGVVPALQAVRAPAGMTATVMFRTGHYRGFMMPRDVQASVSLGEGSLSVAGSDLLPQQGLIGLHLVTGERTEKAWPAHLSVQTLSVQLRRPSMVTTPEGDVPVPAAPDTPPPLLSGNAEADWADLGTPDRLTGTVSAALTPVPFTEAALYWPVHAAKGARNWVNKNITSGMIENLHVALTLGPGRNGKSVDVTGISGGLDGRSMELHWLRPIAAMEDVNAHLTFTDLNTITINFLGGYQPTVRTGHNVGATGTGRLLLEPGSMVIGDLDKKDQTGTITVGLRGDVRDQLALLAEPRLHVLSRHPIPFTHPQGQGEVHFTLRLPLRTHVSTDDMTLDGHAHMTGVHLGNVAIGHGVENGTLDTAVTMHGMTLTGHGLFGRIPADVTGEAGFDRVPAGHVVNHVHARLHLTPDTVSSLDIPVEDYFYNRAELAVDYSSFRLAPDVVTLDLNMKDAGVHIPVWSKAPGVPASAHAELSLEKGQLKSVQNLRASGPDLSLKGAARMLPGGASELILPDFRVKRSVGSANLIIPAHETEAIRVRVRAQTLDLGPLLEGPPHQESAPTTIHVPEAASGKVKGPPGRPWLIDVAAAQLWYSRAQSLGGVKAQIDHNGVRVERLHFTMQTPQAASVEITPVAGGRTLMADVPDLGNLLAGLNVTDLLRGGHAVVRGRFDDTRSSAPFRGKLTISPFVVRKAPAALQYARNLSLYGWLSAKNTSEFTVHRFEMPVSFSDGVLRIRDGRAGNGALGATLEGPVNLDHGTLDLSGTIVPIFAVNALPGGLPAIGRLFAPEKGGGFLAMRFGLTGKLDDPKFSISPLSIFLPGMLREIF